MSLADDLRIVATAATVRKARCSVGSWLDSLPADERDDIAAILADPVSNLSAVSTHMRRSIPTFPAAQTLSRHRRGLCACGAQ